MAAARRDTMRRRVQDFDERCEAHAGARGHKTDPNPFTRDGVRHVQQRPPNAGDAVSAGRERFDDDVGELGTQDSELTQNSDHLTSSSSTSKRSVAFGGMTPPAPRLPYPSCGGIVSVRLPPTFIPATP